MDARQTVLLFQDFWLVGEAYMADSRRSVYVLSHQAVVGKDEQGRLARVLGSVPHLAFEKVFLCVCSEMQGLWNVG